MGNRVGLPQGVLVGNEADVWSLAFAPEGDVIASVGEDRIVRMWNARTKEMLPLRTGHTGTLYSSAFSSRGQLATAGRDGSARIWNVDAHPVEQTK